MCCRTVRSFLGGKNLPQIFKPLSVQHCPNCGSRIVEYDSYQRQNFRHFCLAICNIEITQSWPETKAAFVARCFQLVPSFLNLDLEFCYFPPFFCILLILFVFSIFCMSACCFFSVISILSILYCLLSWSILNCQS